MAAKTIQGRDPISGAFVEMLIEGGVIRSMTPVRPGEELWISPGLIDLQVNGYAGCDLNSDSLTPDLVTKLMHHLFSAGVTTFVPTLITASEDRLIAALRAVAEARERCPLVRQVAPYVHVEGPHIAAGDGPRGAHPGDQVRPADVAEFERWQAASGNLVGMVTLSPHDDRALAYIAHLARRGCLPAIGHTDADPEQIHAAAKAGAVLSTHLGNGLAGELPRHPNLLWAQLAEDRLSATFIADGFHLPPDTLQTMVRAKGVERSILVSDTVSLAGLPPGRYATPIGGSVELTEDGRVGIPGTKTLAGAALPLIRGVAHLARLPGFSLRDGILAATQNPGRFVGHRGTLQVGARADLIQFRWVPGGEIDLIQVLVGGESPVGGR